MQNEEVMKKFLCKNTTDSWMRNVEVNLTFPKFTLEKKTDLKKPLQVRPWICRYLLWTGPLLGNISWSKLGIVKVVLNIL